MGVQQQGAAGHGPCWDQPGRHGAAPLRNPVPPQPACPCRPLWGQSRHRVRDHRVLGTISRAHRRSKPLNLTVNITSCTEKMKHREGKLLVQTTQQEVAELGWDPRQLCSRVYLVTLSGGKGLRNGTRPSHVPCPTQPLQSIPGEEHQACEPSAPNSPENISPWAV